jgi:DNA-binding SARP family transcriptional activator
MTFRLRTFGSVFLERDRAPLGGVHTQRRRLALLAYLAAADGVVTRHKLMAMLWPESDEAGARHSLSQLLYSIRHDLGAEAIRADQETLRLNADVVTSDVHDFDAALDAGQFERAVEEYRGAFLDGFHVDDSPELGRWIEEERARRTGACARALEQLATRAESEGDKHGVVDWRRRRTALDPMDGRETLRLMHALVSVGDRHGALQVARVYETLMREELESEPDREVMQLAMELRRATAVSTPTSNPSPPAIAAPTPPPTRDVASPLPPPALPPPHSPRRRYAAMLAIAAAIVAIVAWNQVRRRDALRSSAVPAVVVLGELGGPDSVLSLAVREALRAELANTRGVRVASDVGVREIMTMMRLPQDSPLHLEGLIGVATRSGAHVAISGSVVPIGAGAQIVVDLLDPATGRSIQTFAERPLDAPAILKAVERIGQSLGAAISVASRDTTVRAFPQVTTASLPALKSYALARQSLARGDRVVAVEHAERAVVHDSTFVLAHYLLGDVLWFLDQQARSDAHLTRAYELSATAPLRERLLIRARYEQLVRDRPDTALVYWGLLLDAFPHDYMVYEGKVWALRALGRHEEAAAAADTAMWLEPAAVVPNTNNAIYSWLAVGDTASALSLAARVSARNPAALAEAGFYAALERRDFAQAFALADSSRFVSVRAWRRQLAHLTGGNIAGARAALDTMRADDLAQHVPRALINQGWMELALTGDRGAAKQYAREALAWLRRRDLSPPAVARLSERIGDLAARAGDEVTVRGALALVVERDHARGLRSYAMAQRTLDAALAYVRGDYAHAASKAAEARHGVYFWRSLVTIVQLEADSRRAARDTIGASSLDRLVATHGIVDGDFETWGLLRTAGAVRKQ